MPIILILVSFNLLFTCMKPCISSIFLFIYWNQFTSKEKIQVKRFYNKCTFFKTLEHDLELGCKMFDSTVCFENRSVGLILTIAALDLVLNSVFGSSIMINGPLPIVILFLCCTFRFCWPLDCVSSSV